MTQNLPLLGKAQKFDFPFLVPTDLIVPLVPIMGDCAVQKLLGHMGIKGNLAIDRFIEAQKSVAFNLNMVCNISHLPTYEYLDADRPPSGP